MKSSVVTVVYRKVNQRRQQCPQNVVSVTLLLVFMCMELLS